MSNAELTGVIREALIARGLDVDPRISSCSGMPGPGPFGWLIVRTPTLIHLLVDGSRLFFCYRYPDPFESFASDYEMDLSSPFITMDQVADQLRIRGSVTVLLH